MSLSLQRPLWCLIPLCICPAAIHVRLSWKGDVINLCRCMRWIITQWQAMNCWDDIASIQEFWRNLKDEIAEPLALVLPFVNSQCSKSLVGWSTRHGVLESKMAWWSGGLRSVLSHFTTSWVVPLSPWTSGSSSGCVCCGLCTEVSGDRQCRG